MSRCKHSVAGVVLATLLSSSAHAAQDTPLNASDRAAIIETLTAKLHANYIEPALAEKLGSAIAKKNAQGGYASAASVRAFSEALQKDLRDVSGDLHFGTRVDDGFRELGRTADVPSRAQTDDARAEALQSGYGIQKVERLPGNVGYIELRGFGTPEFVGSAYTAALSLLAGTDALILDLRRNGGGYAASVAYLMSHFFPLGDVRHLNDAYYRPDHATFQSWTVRSVALRYDKPVYVLTSPRTGSAGEECAYDFQTQGRGTLVGETTAGAANPPRPFSLGHGIVVGIPVGRAINPITKTSWQGVGVKPDIAVPAAQALQTAHAAILRNLMTAAKDDKERTTLQGILAMVERGETETPDYTRRGSR